VQDAAYGTLLRGRRQQLHARIAATLEDQFPEIKASACAWGTAAVRHGSSAQRAIRRVFAGPQAGEQHSERRSASERRRDKVRKPLCPQKRT